MEYYLNPNHMFFLGELGNGLWDKNGLLTDKQDIVVRTPIGKNSDITLEQAFDIRCKAVAQTDKKVYVYWSGGLDSTAVFLALKNYLPTKDLAVLYTEQSLKEYPGFFESQILNSHEAIRFEDGNYGETTETYCNQGIVVTGEIADQVFGPGLLGRLGEEALQKHWSCFNNGFLLKLKNIDLFAEASPQKINNVADMLWWINYALRYQHVQMRMLLDNKSAVLDDNFIHFYDTVEFNDYAVTIPTEEKIPGFLRSNHKYPLRQLIFALGGDKDYAFEKPKVASWNPKKYGHEIANSLTTNWTRIYN